MKLIPATSTISAAITSVVAIIRAITPAATVVVGTAFPLPRVHNNANEGYDYPNMTSIHPVRDLNILCP